MLFHLEGLAHDHLLLFEFLEQLAHLLDFGVLWVESVQVIVELLRLPLEARNADKRVFADDAILVISMPAPKMHRFVSLDDPKMARLTKSTGVETVQLRLVVLAEPLLQRGRDQVGGNVEDVD